MNDKPIVVSASPRDGNGAYLARRMAERYDVRIVTLRNYTVAPCIGCGACAASPHDCVFDAADDARDLLDALCVAPAVVLVSPVYFYGPPAHLKALIDRAQRIWEIRTRTAGSGKIPAGQSSRIRPFGGIYTAERVRGEKLFVASELIADCFAQIIGCQPQKSLCLRGIENTTGVQSSENIFKFDSWTDSFFGCIGCL